MNQVGMKFEAIHPAEIITRKPVEDPFHECLLVFQYFSDLCMMLLII